MPPGACVYPKSSCKGVGGWVESLGRREKKTRISNKAPRPMLHKMCVLRSPGIAITPHGIAKADQPISLTCVCPAPPRLRPLRRVQASAEDRMPRSIATQRRGRPSNAAAIDMRNPTPGSEQPWVSRKQVALFYEHLSWLRRGSKDLIEIARANGGQCGRIAAPWCLPLNPHSPTTRP